MSTSPTQSDLTEGTVLQSLTVGFVVDSVEHQVIMCTRNFKNITFENGSLHFKATDYPAEYFETPDALLAKSAFNNIWKKSQEIFFDIEVRMDREDGSIILKESSIKPSKLSPFLYGAFIDLDKFDKDVLKPYTEGRIITGVIKTVVKGSQPR